MRELVPIRVSLAQVQTLSFYMRGPRGKLTDDGSKGERHDITSPRAMLIRLKGYELYGANRSNWCDCAGREINRFVTGMKNIDAEGFLQTNSYLSICIAYMYSSSRYYS